MATTSLISTAKAQQGTQALDEKSKSRLQKAVRDFEALFVGYMLKSMRETLSKEDEFGDNFGGDMLEGMFDTEMARQMSKNSNFGLGEKLYREMTGETLPMAVPHSPNALPAPAASKPAVQAKAEAAPVVAPAASTKPAPIVVHAAPRVIPADTAAVDTNVSALEPIIQEAADTHGLDPNLLKAVIASESGGNVRARSSKNAKGVMQLVDSTASDMGVRNVWNPRENILGGAKYLQQLLQRFEGDTTKAVASYNAGPGAVEKHGGIPPFKETREYVSRVMEYLRHFEQQEGAGNEQ